MWLTPGFTQNNGIIQGRIVDEITNQSLPFVNIVLTNTTDSYFIQSLQSNGEGTFIIKNLALSTYSIRLSYMGYQVKFISKLNISAEKPGINLADVTLNPDNKMLNEVVIEYKRPLIEMLDDKLVYNVDQGLFSEGSVASDLLKNVPMVSVDIDGKATIAGRRNTRIFIDGKPSDFSANNIAELLNVLPSDALESIEVITDPSSKFDADGDGIINLVMKKGVKIGLNGNVSTRAGTLGNYNAGAFLSSRKKEDFSWNASTGYNHNIRSSDASSYRSNIFTDTLFYNNQSNSAERLTGGMNARFSGTYQPDSARTLKFSAQSGFGNGNTFSNSTNLYLNDKHLESRLRTQINNTGNNTLNYVIDADYEFKGKNKNQYSLGINYNRNTQEDSRDYSRYLYNPDGSLRDTEPDLQLNNNSNVGNNLQLSADINKAYNFLNLKVETGAKFNLNNSDNNQQVRKFDYNTGDYEINPFLTNSFDFRQNIYAGYFSLKFGIQKFTFRAGTRAEITSVSFNKKNIQNTNLNPYLNLFPSLSITRTFNSKYRIGLNYSRRVTRPRYNALNPIIDDSDPQNIKFGNANLKPSFTNQYELSLTIFGKAWSISPRINYAASYKIIERIKTVINDAGDTETTFQNLANSSTLSFNTFANYQIDKTKSMNCGLAITRVNYNSSGNASFNRSGNAIKANAGTSYSFNKKTGMELNLNYVKNAAAQGTAHGSVQTQFGFKRNFMKNKMSARITITDPFSQRTINSITEGPNFYQESLSVQKTRNFMAGLSYRFTKISK